MAEIVSSSFVQPQNDHLAEETGAKTTAEAAALAEKLNNRMTKRHARLKEKWSADRQEGSERLVPSTQPRNCSGTNFNRSGSQ